MTVRARVAAAGALALAAGVLSIIPGADAQAPPAPRFGENYRLPPLSASRARDVPGLAVNPNDPNHIVEAENDPINLQCDYRVSFDGGQTWTGGHLTVKGGGEIPPFPAPTCNQNFDSGGYMHFNTGIVFGSGQNVYVTFSVKRGPFNRPESGIDNAPADQSVVARSTDGGRTFQPAVVAIDSPNAPQPFRVRPQLAVQREAGAGGQDRLYVAAWECFIKIRASQTTRGGCSGGGGDRRIFVARSEDGGTTWTDPVLASAANVRAGGPCSPACTPATAAAEAGSPDEQAREPSQPVVGPDGAVYVAYRSRDITDGTTCPVNPSITAAAGGFSANKAHCIVIARSTNEGEDWQQFSTNLPVSTGTLSNPRLAIDPSTPAGVGTLYVVYQRPPFSGAVPPTSNNTDTDVVFQKSTDRGETWSDFVRVNDDTLTVTQTNPSVSVAPDGSVDVIWADRRHSYPGGGSHADMYYARSTDGGTSFGTNRRVTDRTINIDVGRYNELGSQFSSGFSWYGPVSLPLAGGRVLAAWQDSREGNFDTGFQDIYLSRLDPAAAIARKRIATATGPGLSVMLSRLAYPGGPEAVGGAGGEPVSKVVVANENDVAGALAGAVLARANWAPLMLSPAGGLPAIVKADAARMKPEGGFVIGNTSSLSTGVSEGLRETTRDGENVVRVAAPANVVAGNRPADTARRVADLMRPLPGASPEAVIADPSTPEAASAAGLAAALKLPILFVDNRGNPPPPGTATTIAASIPPPTEAAISSLGIKQLLIVGDSDAVNQKVEDRLENSPANPVPADRGLGLTVERLGGADQYLTSEAVLTEAKERGLPANVVYVADDARPTEAAVLGAAVGRVNGLMLLRPGADATSAEARLTAPLGVAPAVDRLVAAIGTGGTDPVASTVSRAPGIGSPLPPASLAVDGCPPARIARKLISLSNGNDARNGTPLSDTIFAGAGNDVVDSLAGDDCVDLGPGTDRGQGGLGDDYVLGGLGPDRVSGGSGNDRIRGNSGSDRLGGGSGNDRLIGDSGNDRISGSRGNDRLQGGGGRDRLAGSRGRDRISGGGGRDTVSGGSSGDRIAGDASGDRINGNSGNDRISGNSGNDRLTGSTGRDRISGGSGADRINSRDGRRDIVNCGSGNDRVRADSLDVVRGNCETVSTTAAAAASLGGVPALVGAYVALLGRRRRRR